MDNSERIAGVDGKGSDEGAASVLAYRIGSTIEILAIENGSGDALQFFLPKRRLRYLFSTEHCPAATS